MGERSVDDMLETMTSHELAEWQAYERIAGPIDGSWSNETLATMQELMQSLLHLLGAAHFTDKKNKKNPVREPQHWPRPNELWQKKVEFDSEGED